MQDFRHLREKNGYYVDKTQMIEEFLESGYQITLLTRPRRFGKTLNMSMLAEFLDCTKQSADIFAGTKISESPVVQEILFYRKRGVILCSKIRFSDRLGGFRKDSGHEMYCSIMTIVETLKKRKMGIIENLKTLFLGTPAIL